MTRHLTTSNNPKHNYCGNYYFGMILYTDLNSCYSLKPGHSSLNSLIPALRSSKSKTCTTFNQKKSHPVLVFLSCGNACIANYRRSSRECSNAGKETRVQTKWWGEYLVRHRQRAAKHQRSTWKPMALPRRSVSLSALAHSAIEERRIQNTNTGSGQAQFAAGVRGGVGRRRMRQYG